MESLGELQLRFQSHILNPGNSDRISWVSVAGRASPRYQLSVYANAYALRLKEVLESDYPAVGRAIGSERFDDLAEGYIQHYPSHSFTLREYGSHFQCYVDGKVRSDPAYVDKAWLAELAGFEWTLGRVFDAADCEQVKEQEMASIAADEWPQLRFEFIPASCRLDLEWNVAAMWKGLSADPPVEITPYRDERPGSWLIWRQDLVTRFRSLGENERLVLDALRAGATFNDACGLLARRMDPGMVPIQAAGLLKGWIQQGLIGQLATGQGSVISPSLRVSAMFSR